MEVRIGIEIGMKVNQYGKLGKRMKFFTRVGLAGEWIFSMVMFHFQTIWWKILMKENRKEK